jgi:hypothetical protein
MLSGCLLSSSLSQRSIIPCGAPKEGYGFDFDSSFTAAAGCAGNVAFLPREESSSEEVVEEEDDEEAEDV